MARGSQSSQFKILLCHGSLPWNSIHFCLDQWPRTMMVLSIPIISFPFILPPTSTIYNTRNMHIAQGMPRIRQAGGASAARNGHRGRVGGVSGQRRRVARSWRPRPRRASWRRATWSWRRASWRRRASWQG